MSSTVSCSSAAQSVSVSSRSPAQIFATSTGWLTNSSPERRRWSAWRSQAKAKARSTSRRSTVAVGGRVVLADHREQVPEQLALAVGQLSRDTRRAARRRPGCRARARPTRTWPRLSSSARSMAPSLGGAAAPFPFVTPLGARLFDSAGIAGPPVRRPRRRARRRDRSSSVRSEDTTPIQRAPPSAALPQRRSRPGPARTAPPPRASGRSGRGPRGRHRAPRRRARGARPPGRSRRAGRAGPTRRPSRARRAPARRPTPDGGSPSPHAARASRSRSGMRRRIDQDEMSERQRRRRAGGERGPVGEHEPGRLVA